MSPLSTDTPRPEAEHARPHPMRSLLILGLAALSYALAQTAIIPAVSVLATDFHTDTAGVAWILTGYLISAAIFTPIFGRFGDMFGKRKMLTITLAIFAAGSVVSAFGTSVEVIVIGRVLQGVGGGTFPLCFGIIRDEFPKDRVATSIGLISATAGIGGGLGLVLGGLILDNTTYHWIFWIGAIMATIAAVAAHFLVPESPNRTPGKVDYRGAAVLAVGLTIPLYAVSEANNWGWTSPKLLGLTAIGFAVLGFWVWLEKRTDEPLADIPLLSKRPVLMTNIATLFIGFGMFCTFILIPQLVEAPKSTGYGFDFSATQAGLIMLPAALMMLVAGPASGMIGSRYGNRVPMALGGVIAGLGLFLLGIDHSSTLAIFCWNAVCSVGVGLAFAAMPNLIMESVPMERTGEATGFNTLIRSVGSSLGSQVTAAILTGSIVAGATLPTDQGFKTALFIAAGVSIFAGLMATVIPSRGAASAVHESIGEEIGAASPLGEPALAGGND